MREEYAYDLVYTNDKLFLLSYTEIFGDNKNYSWDTFNEGVQYDYFKTQSNRIIKDSNGNAVWWWLRTPVVRNNTDFYRVNIDGTYTVYGANLNEFVIPSFVLG